MSSRDDKSQRSLERAKAISKSRDTMQREQPAPALYIIVKWDSTVAGEPYYKKSEADEVCDRFYGPLARVVEYVPKELHLRDIPGVENVKKKKR